MGFFHIHFFCSVRQGQNEVCFESLKLVCWLRKHLELLLVHGNDVTGGVSLWLRLLWRGNLLWFISLCQGEKRVKHTWSCFIISSFFLFIYKNFTQSRIIIYIIQIHQQNNLLKSQLLVFKLKLTILEISLISRRSLFHKSAPEYLKDLQHT